VIGERYNLDPSYGHGFGEHLIERVPYDSADSPESLEAYGNERLRRD
jgi:hypothetical protein